MNQNGAEGAMGASHSQNRKRSHDGKMVNGERNTPKVEGPADPHSANDMLPSSVQMDQLPPEIQHITSEHYQPLSKLLTRISQECFNDLSELLTTMADMPVAQQPNGPLTNGVGGHTATNGAGKDASPNNVQKKLLLMKFAQDQRAKFIKLLVISEWAKKSPEVSKLIDLRAWMGEQISQMDAVVESMAHLRMALKNARQPNPDMKTALEILSSGKASWIPDLGFIEAPPISAEKALKVLRHLNTSLAVRLNLHENLPRHLKVWRIGSGRATFVIPSECEFDVLTYSEDTSAQWLFQDLRFLFSPAPVVPTGTRFMMTLKHQLDQILYHSGLSGCFDFLHNLVLTHKIAILTSQAHELLVGNWAGSIKVEPVHRSLVVQYWVNKPGKKNWIEIGLSSGKPKNGKVTWRGPGISCLTVRWFRHGVEVKDVALDFDWNNLSMERMLRRVIALHIGHLMRTYKDQIIAQNAIRPGLTATTKLSDTEPGDCALEVSLGNQDNSTTVLVDPVTGRYALRPCTPRSAEAAHHINNDPHSNVPSTIARLLASTLQDFVYRHAQQLGWPEAKRNLRSDVIKQSTKIEAMRYSLYRPQGWTSKWALASLIDASGVSWWILELAPSRPAIEHAEQIKVEKKVPIDRKSLASIERVALSILTALVTTRVLKARRIPFSFEHKVALLSPARQSATSQSAVHGWVLQLRTSDLLEANADQQIWARSCLRITCHGFSSDKSETRHIVSGTMLKDLRVDMQKLMSSSPKKDFTFSANGAFSLFLATPFGEPIVDPIASRLRDLDRLRSFITTIKKRGMRLESSSLEQVKFRYGEHSVATVRFDQNDDRKGEKGEIGLSFEPGNPHNRIRPHLAKIINEKDPKPFELRKTDGTGLDRFSTTLLYTRPLHCCFNDIEAENPGDIQNPNIHVRDVGHYRVKYANPLCSFDVRVRSKHDRTYWHIEDNDKKIPDSRPTAERPPNHKRAENLKTALTALFREKGEGWLGVRTGIVAEIDGVQNAVKKLHETVRNCAVRGADNLSADGSGMGTSTQDNGKNPSAKDHGHRSGNAKDHEVIEID
ncbi:MED14-domain-containing protein [Zopfia rhizophila CBS 207.26]|uniref:Mediator of RNA polymerase II transcription subunit 14 n=1 Tax=Zopfia rhizophila CBS 207.26 TaxID=1314779 RepID=A0A6A6DFL1_9PEZI|nr:MED14-domain-containing protein [Zopfia rhizophila CBS 207.26]